MVCGKYIVNFNPKKRGNTVLLVNQWWNDGAKQVADIAMNDYHLINLLFIAPHTCKGLLIAAQCLAGIFRCIVCIMSSFNQWIMMLIVENANYDDMPNEIIDGQISCFDKNYQ